MSRAKFSSLQHHNQLPPIVDEMPGSLPADPLYDYRVERSFHGLELPLSQFKNRTKRVSFGQASYRIQNVPKVRAR